MPLLQVSTEHNPLNLLWLLVSLLMYYYRYKCHKTCSKLAPATCGLPQDFLNYARNNMHLLSHDGPTQPQFTRQRNFSSSGEYSVAPPTSPKIDDDAFVIPDLNREPTNSK